MSMSRRFLWSALGWLALFSALFANVFRNREAIIFWDEHCYVGQARFLAENGFHFAAYRQLEFLRPPLFTGSLALLIRGFPEFGPLLSNLRLVTCALGLLLLPLVFALCRELGGRVRTAWLAVALCAVSPLYISQLGLVLSDVPTAVLTTLAWLLLLRRNVAGFVIISTLAVLSKESAYFLCAPAFLLLWWRGARSIRELWPSAWPGMVLAAWLLVHRALVGQAIPSVNGAMVGITSLPEALLHNFIEGGRILLFSSAIVALRAARPPQPIAELRATGAAVVALPLLFAAVLPRYMLLSLPLLCVLAALYLDTLSFSRRVGLGIFYFCISMIGLRSWPAHGEGGYHLDSTQVYRQVQTVELQAANTLATQPREVLEQGVLAHFPMFESLHSDRLNGFALGPLPKVTLADDGLPLEVLCRHHFLVVARPGISVDAVRNRLAEQHALRPWAHFGSKSNDITIYEINCSTR